MMPRHTSKRPEGMHTETRRRTHLPEYIFQIGACSQSFGKALALLHMIWDYPLAFGHAIELFVLSCNCVALKV